MLLRKYYEIYTILTISIMMFSASKLWISTKSFYDMFISFFEDNFHHLIFSNFLFWILLSISLCLLKFSVGDVSSLAIKVASERVSNILFYFFYLIDGNNYLAEHLFAFYFLFIHMIIQKKVEDLYSSISLPSPKQHIRIMYGQLTMSLLSIYFFFKYNSTFFHMHYSTIFVETLQGIFSHFIVLYDRENVGNSQSSYRLIFVSQIISESTNCILRVIFLALEARRAISLGLGSFTFFVLSKNILDNVNKLRESFKKFNDWKRMQSLFNDYLPSANSADIEHDNTCIICRLEMTENDSKKLPCGHCLHTDCLERWTMQQMKCPICRYDLDEMLKEAERKKNEEEKREIIVDNNEQEENVNVNNEQTFTYDELNDDDNGE